MDLKKRKRFPEVPDGRTQVQGDTLLCIKGTKFSFLLVIEKGGGGSFHWVYPNSISLPACLRFFEAKASLRKFFVVKIDFFIGHCAFSQFRYRPNCVSQFHFVGPQELGLNFFLMAVKQIAADKRNVMSNI